ncbi:MAG: hypothetical protein H6822_01355 [Planctomycetaceae bacterium]|nr:hypothetical protein [Planctomycetales bacterium]MCB9920793.1 hypothetical protein [Planctomycetaceae bacterium]
MKIPNDEVLREMGMTAEEFISFRRRQKRNAALWMFVAIGGVYASMVWVRPVAPTMATVLGCVSLVVVLHCFGEVVGLNDHY